MDFRVTLAQLNPGSIRTGKSQWNDYFRQIAIAHPTGNAITINQTAPIKKTFHYDRAEITLNANDADLSQFITNFELLRQSCADN
jgi:hypothetical protein